jgi:glycosyltransferase involved in cell wall biosynthesis
MQPHLPLVTIAIPVYNQEQYVASAIESALIQTYPNLEVIVSDDASTDRTKEICQRYLSDGRFKYFRNESNLGRVANYRKLFYELASGDWYVNLDGDDYYTDIEFIGTGIKKIMGYLGKGFEVMWYHSALQVEMDGELVPVVPNIYTDCEVISGKEYFTSFFKLNAASHLTIICNRSKALSIDYYSRDTLFSDVHSFLRLALHGHIILDKRMSAVWRFHNQNASLSLENKLQEEIRSREDISKYALSFVTAKESQEWLQQAKAQLSNNLVYKNIRKDQLNPGDWQRFFRHFRFSGFFIRHFFKYVLLSFKKRKPETSSNGS